jgi:hypothetical protein
VIDVSAAAHSSACVLTAYSQFIDKDSQSSLLRTHALRRIYRAVRVAVVTHTVSTLSGRNLGLGTRHSSVFWPTLEREGRVQRRSKFL